ncbi:MAG TPA: peptidylprolyl isomerase [candidate division Zixibacteria bacterium]
MNRFRFCIFLLVSLFLAANDGAFGASSSSEISREEVLAKVNDEPITVGRFYDFIKEEKASSHQVIPREKTKDEIMHELIRQTLIQQRKAVLDLDTDSAFVRSRNLHMRDFLLNYMYQRDVVEKTKVTDQEVKEHYQKYKDVDFLVPEEVQVRDLLIRVTVDSTLKDFKKRSKQADKEASRKIKELRKRALSGEDFADLCRQYSQAGVADASANLGFIQRGQFTPEFDSVAFSLKEMNQISKPVRDSKGYHLIQLLDRKEKSYQPLDSTLFEGIREYLKNQKIQESTNDYIDSLKNSLGLVYHWEVLNSPDLFSYDRDTWVLACGETDTVRLGLYEDALPGYKYNMGLDSLTEEDKEILLFHYLALPAILEKEARKKGYGDSVEYQAEKRAFTLEEADRRISAERIKQDFPPSSRQEIEKYYLAHKIDFPPLGVPLHVYHMVFDDSLKAVEILKQIQTGADFVKLAQEHFPGDSEIKDVVYDLGFISRGEMPEEFYQAALKLKEGEVSQPVRTQWGFHLIQLVEKKDQGTTLEDLTPQIQRAINLEKGRRQIAEWEENLFAQSKVWINQKLLKKLTLPKPEG